MGPVADLADVAVGDRLARGGITAEQAAALVDMDPRSVADAATATTAAVERLARWLRAGQPLADVDRLMFEGDDAVRALVVELIERVPVAVAWHAIEFCEWVEIGRGADGTCSAVVAARAPAGDSAHRIRLCGMLPDERIRHILPHELAHSMHRTVCAREPTFRSMPAIERDARALLIARDLGIAQPEVMIADHRAEVEYLAESTAQAWGFARPPLHAEAMRRRKRFIADLNAASELVPSIRRASAIGGTS